MLCLGLVQNSEKGPTDDYMTINGLLATVKYICVPAYFLSTSFFSICTDHLMISNYRRLLKK